MKTLNMTDKEMASRLSALPGWRWAEWMPVYSVSDAGMVDDEVGVVTFDHASEEQADVYWCSETESVYVPADSIIPALDCPSIVGHLLDALGDGWSIRHDPDRTTAEVYTAWCPGIGRGDGSTRARACADALLELGWCPGWEASP